MAHALYMDVHVPSAVTEGLRRRGVDVLTSQEDGTRAADDEPPFGTIGGTRPRFIHARRRLTSDRIDGNKTTANSLASFTATNWGQASE